MLGAFAGHRGELELACGGIVSHHRRGPRAEDRPRDVGDRLQQHAPRLLACERSRGDRRAHVVGAAHLSIGAIALLGAHERAPLRWSSTLFAVAYRIDFT